jgi:hypothetical protein
MSRSGMKCSYGIQSDLGPFYNDAAKRNIYQPQPSTRVRVPSGQRIVRGASGTPVYARSYFGCS